MRNVVATVVLLPGSTADDFLIYGLFFNIQNVFFHFCHVVVGFFFVLVKSLPVIVTKCI
jgi:hypothetical protein